MQSQTQNAKTQKGLHTAAQSLNAAKHFDKAKPSGALTLQHRPQFENGPSPTEGMYEEPSSLAMTSHTLGFLEFLLPQNMPQ